MRHEIEERFHPQNLKDVVSFLAHENRDDIEQGFTFFDETDLGAKAKTYVELIEVLENQGLDSSSARSGFAVTLQDINNIAFTDPLCKARGDLAQVHLLLHEDKPDTALSQARAIFAITNPKITQPLAEEMGLGEMSMQQIKNTRMDALSDVAEYLIDHQRTDDVNEIIQEMIIDGDHGRFLSIYYHLGNYYRQNNQEDKIGKLAEELKIHKETVRTALGAMFGFDDDDPLTEMILSNIDTAMNQLGKKVAKDTSWGSISGWRIDKSFRLPGEALLEKTKSELLQLDKIESREKLESKIASIVTSVCANLDSRDAWNNAKVLLKPVLAQIGDLHASILQDVTDQDGKIKGRTVVEKQGNVSIELHEEGSKEPSSHYYWVTKMELSDAARRFSDFDSLLEILQEHFSLSQIVHFMKRVK